MYIQLQDVSKTIKGKNILKEVTLSLEKGKIYGFVGHNGSGKTMLFRALCGFIRLSSGKITINQQDVVFNEPLPEKIGIIIETPGFILDYSGIENLRYLAKISHVDIEPTIEMLLKKFKLYDHKDEKVKKYSLGMKQKLAIIQAVMENQELIILDEPTNGLDKASIAIFEEMMLDLKAQGKTILIASHNDINLNSIADEIYELNDGALVYDKEEAK